MLSTLRNAWKVPDLRKRLIFTVLMVAIFRIGNFIPVPGIDASKIARYAGSGSLLGFYDLLSGGAFTQFSIFAMGVVPYINASIVMQLLTIAIPYLEQLSKEGEEGRKKIQNYTKYAAVVFGLLQAFGSYAIIYNAQALTDTSKLGMFLIVLTLTTASTFLMWLGDQITVKGIGNGASLFIFVGIIAKFSTTAGQIATLQQTQTVNVVSIIFFIAVVALLLAAVIAMSLAERRIPVQYAGKSVNGKSYRGQSSHIPLNMNATGVIAIIFAMSVMQFPQTIAQFNPTWAFSKFVNTSPYSIFKQNSLPYIISYFVLTIFFSWFYAEVTFKPDEMAENMHKSSGFIPGIRPGEYTAKYIEKILIRISILGGAFAALIAIFPIIIQGYTNFQNIYFGGTALLILVGVALDSMRQIEAQLVMRHYQGFLK